MLFKQIRPVLLGKILYAPNTKAYANLIKKANSTFENAETLLRYIGTIADTGSFVIKSLELNEIYIQALKEQLQITQSTDTIILQIKLIIEQLYFIRNLGYCVELDKFVGYPSESEAIRIGGELLVNSNFWGAFIFQNSEINGQNNVSQLPNIISYKIRMNSSLTHNTFYTQDIFYKYGPSNSITSNYYFLYGFIYMQDMLEKGNILCYKYLKIQGNLNSIIFLNDPKMCVFMTIAYEKKYF